MKQSGITILELMVVLAIVAILASVAVPSYQNYTNAILLTIWNTLTP